MDTSQKRPLLFDDLLVKIGGTGAYQIIYFIIMCLFGIISVESIFINFIAAKQPHWCKVKELEDLPYDVQKIVAIPSDDANDWISSASYSQCQMFNLNYSAYTTEDFLLWNRTVQAAGNIPVNCVNGWVYDKSEFVSSIVSEWDLVCGQEWMVPLVSTAFVGGQFLGSISAGYLSDRFGRRPALIICFLVKLGGGLFSAFAPNYGAMLAARAIIGFGSTGSYIITFILALEVSTGLARTVFGTGLGVAYAIGYMIVPGLALGVRDFRKLSIVMAAPNIIAIFIWWIVPESPRWLLLQGRYKEADRVIRFIADVNNHPLPQEFDVSTVTMDDGKNVELPKRNILDLFKRPTIRKWTLVVYLHWFTDTLVYYALSLNAGSLAGDLFLNTFLLGLVEIPANVLLAFGIEWRVLGRRLTSSFSLLMAGGTSIICIPLIVTGASPAATTALSIIGKGAATMAFSAAYVYTGEIFPTEVRNVAMGSASTVGRISSMAAPFVGSVLGNTWSGLPYLIYGVFGVVTGVLALLLPETLGQPLYDTLEEAEALGKSKKAVGPHIPIESCILPQHTEVSAEVKSRKPTPLSAQINLGYIEESK